MTKHFENESLREYLQNHFPSLLIVVDAIIKNKLTNWGHFIAILSAENKFQIQHKDWVNCKITISEGIVYAEAGANRKKENYGYNEFLNYPMPNYLYVIDEYLLYKTDNNGRVIEASAKFKNGETIYRRGTPPLVEEQKRVITSKDGDEQRDQGGHIISKDIGGPYEQINQVPMLSTVNQGGLWKIIENCERDAWYKRKEVFTKRRLYYNGSSMRPYKFEVQLQVDRQPVRFDEQEVLIINNCLD